MIFFGMIMPNFTGVITMKKELYIFIAIFLFLSIGMHYKEWLSHPIEHIMALPKSGAYGIGMVHPVVFTLFGYILFVVARSIVRLFGRFGRK